MIMYIFINNFEENKEKLSTNIIARKLQISINLTQNIINFLIKIGLLTKIDSEDDLNYFC